MFRRFLEDRVALASLVLLTIFCLIAVVGPLLMQTDPAQQTLSLRRAPPSAEHPFGLDHLGRDVLSRLVHGARYTIVASFGATVLVTLVGLFAGIGAGYRGGWVDQLVMRAADVLLAFPVFLAAIVIVAVLGPDLRNAIIAVAIARVPAYARIIRGAALQAREMAYAEAARAVGCRDARIMARHILPNVILPAVVLSTVEMAGVVLSLSGLSFLGLGAQPPASEWGLMMSEAKGYLTQAPHLMLFPGSALALLVIAINLVGDGLRVAIDPRAGRR